MNYDEKLNLILAKLDALEGSIRQVRPRATSVGSPSKPVTEAEIDAALAAISAAIGGSNSLPSRQQVRQWLGFGRTPSELAAAALDYLEPYRALAELQAAQEGPGTDWRPFAIHLAVHKSHDQWNSMYHPLTGASVEPTPYVPPADEKSHLFGNLQIKPSIERVEALVEEVIARAEEGYNYAGSHVTAGTLEKAKKALAGEGWLSPEWDGWVDSRLFRVLVLTGILETSRPGFTAYQDYKSWKKLSLEEWLMAQWVAFRHGNGLR